MIFTADSIDKIRSGRKTQTRRLWKVTHVRPGGVYRVRASRFAAFNPSDPAIRVTAVRIEALAAITPEDARREGFATIAEFREAWVRLHRDWHDPDRVHVVDFELAERPADRWRQADAGVDGGAPP